MVASVSVLRLRARRFPILRLALALVLIVLAIVLVWHLVGMDHNQGMGAIHACLFLLLAVLSLVAPAGMWRVRPAGVRLPSSAWPAPLEPVSRPPPGDGSLEGVVLVC